MKSQNLNSSEHSNNKMSNERKAGLVFMTMFALIVVMFSLVSAETPHKQNTDLKFSITSNFADQCILTTVNTLDEVIFINQNATKTSQTFNYTIDSSNYTSLGITCHQIECSDSTQKVTESYCREVTLNGKKPAEGIVIVIFSLIFIGIIAFGIIYFLKSLAHVIQLEMDLIDASIMIATYLAMWMFYYVSFEYLGNAVINGLLETAISVGAVTHVFLPLVGFAVSFIMTNLRFKQKARITY